MTIEIRSLGDALGFILALVSVLSVFSWAHWKLFAAPIIKKALSPMTDNIAVNSRLLKKKFPDDYERFTEDVHAERVMRGST